MEYRVEALAQAAHVNVDTVRFYQTRGLLQPPERRGRIAIYGDDHLARLRRIRELNRSGLTLAAVGRVLDGESRAMRVSLLDAIVEVEGERTYTRAELAAETRVPELVLRLVEDAGLLEPVHEADEALYTDTDRRSVESAERLLSAGVPLADLLELAQRHAAHTDAVCDAAIELFDRHVRRDGDADAPDVESVTRAFRDLLPAVTTLVALHFQRSLVRRARARLSDGEDAGALDAALEATTHERLSVRWA